jgi:hypothetical protein
MSQPDQALPQPSGILTVAENRGFVVETSDPLMGRPVITAAHCLPTLPATENAAVFSDESTYPDLLGPLGQTPTVWAQCLFVDPVSDLAVLASPDNQALFDQWEAYQNLLKSVSPFPVSDASLRRPSLALLARPAMVPLPHPAGKPRPPPDLRRRGTNPRRHVRLLHQSRNMTEP